MLLPRTKNVFPRVPIKFRKPDYKNILFGNILHFYKLFFQNIILDPKGAFIFGTDWDGYAKEHGNAWCSMFAFQALSLASGSATRDQVLEHLV